MNLTIISADYYIFLTILNKIARNKAVFIVYRHRLAAHTNYAAAAPRYGRFIEKLVFFHFFAVGRCGFFDLKRVYQSVYFCIQYILKLHLYQYFP